MQSHKEELELEKLQAEVHKLNAEARKFKAEADKIKREAMFYPFVATGGIITVGLTAIAFVSKL